MPETVDTLLIIHEYRAGLQTVLDALPVADVSVLIGMLEMAYEDGRHVFVVGNGGSAATASHLACDLAKTVHGSQRHAAVKRFRILALTDNMPLITAYGNDAGFETIFAEPLRNLASEGDMLIAITGSGNSPNIIAAVNVARELGLQSVGLLGFAGGQAARLVDHAIIVDSDNYGHIEDAHMVLVHLVTQYFKRLLAQPLGAKPASGPGR